MNGLDYRDGSIIYTDDTGERFLIDASDYTSNISRVPLHGEDELLTVGKFVISLMQKHGEISANTPQEGRAPYYTVTDALVAGRLTKICGPKAKKPAIAIIGKQGSTLENHISRLVELFDPEIVFCTIEEPEVSDFESFREYFDIVLADGSLRFEDPKFVLEYGMTIKKKDGIIITYMDRQPLLESVFFLLNPEREEYRFGPDASVLVAE